MASAGGKEVGRVSIRVVPDMDVFRKELVRELKKIERTVKLKIPVELDTKSVAKQLLKMRAQMSGMSGINLGSSSTAELEETIKKTEVRVRSLRELLTKALHPIQGIRSGFSAITERVKAAHTAVGQFRGEIDKIKQTKLDGVNAAKFFKNLQSGNTLGTEKIGRLRSSLIGLTATLRGLGNASGRGLQNLGRNVIDSDMKFKKLRATTRLVGRELNRGFGAAGKSLKGLIGLATLGATGFGKLSRFGKIFVAVLAAAPAILGVISALIAGLPSLLAAAGVGALALALGMDGIKKAAKGFSESLKPLKEQISSVFEKGLTPQFAAVSKLLYSLKPGLVSVSNGLIEMSGAFVKMITTGQGLKDINTLVNNTGTFFKDLAPFVADFFGGFFSLAADASTHFGLLTDVLKRFGVAWKQFADRIGGNGVLKGALEGLAKVTDSLLQGFLKLTESGLGAMIQVAGPLANALSSVIDLLAAVMPILGVLASAVLTVVSAVAQALTPVLTALQPIFQQIATIIAQALVPVIQALAPGVMALATFLGELFVAISPLFPILAELGKVLSTVVMSALNALKPILPVISAAFQKVATVITGAMANGLPILQDIAATLGTALADAINTIAPLLPNMIQAFADFVTAILPLLPPLLRLVGEILPILIELYMRLYPAILAIVTAITNFLVPILNTVIDVLADLIGWIGTFTDEIATAGEQILRWFKDLPGNLWDILKNAGSWLWDTGKNIIQGLWNGLIDKWNGVKRWIQDRANEISNLFKSALGINSPSTVFIAIGRDTMRGLQMGLDAMAPDALNSVRNVAEEMATIGSDMSAVVTGEGGLELFGAGLEEKIVSALEGWRVQQDPKGTFNMNRTATRDNKYGR